MKAVRIILLGAALVAGSMFVCIGCGKADDGTGGDDKTEEGGGGYFHTLAESHRKGREEPNLLSVRNELKQFQALKGRWPESLQEFKQWRGADLPELPEGRGFDYDPASGELKIVDTEPK